MKETTKPTLYVFRDEYSPYGNAIMYSGKGVTGCGILDGKEPGSDSIAQRIVNLVLEGHKLKCGQNPKGKSFPLPLDAKNALMQKLKINELAMEL